MGLTARDKGGGDFQPIPEDVYIAICYGIWDIGTQFSEKYGKAIHKVVIVWELPSCRADFERDGKQVNLPRATSKRYTLSLHKKADLRKDLESWRGKKFTDEELRGFDLKKLLGVPCQLQILHNKVDEKTYANIAAIIKAPAGTKLQTENPLTFFSFEDGTPIPAGTPDWIKDLIQQSEEYGDEGRIYEDVSDHPPVDGEETVPF